MPSEAERRPHGYEQFSVEPFNRRGFLRKRKVACGCDAGQHIGEFIGIAEPAGLFVDAIMMPISTQEVVRIACRRTTTVDATLTAQEGAWTQLRGSKMESDSERAALRQTSRPSIGLSRKSLPRGPLTK